MFFPEAGSSHLASSFVGHLRPCQFATIADDSLHPQMHYRTAAATGLVCVLHLFAEVVKSLLLLCQSADVAVAWLICEGLGDHSPQFIYTGASCAFVTRIERLVSMP